MFKISKIISKMKNFKIINVKRFKIKLLQNKILKYLMKKL